jgi:hypothetical protein
MAPDSMRNLGFQEDEAQGGKQAQGNAGQNASTADKTKK